MLVPFLTDVPRTYHADPTDVLGDPGGWACFLVPIIIIGFTMFAWIVVKAFTGNDEHSGDR